METELGQLPQTAATETEEETAERAEIAGARDRLAGERVRKDQAETSVLFELIAERYERRSILITANQPFSGWSNVLPDPGMTVAAIDRLVHHSTIFELNKVESYRDKVAAREQKLQRDNDKAQRKRQSSGDNDNQPNTPAILTDAVHAPPPSFTIPLKRRPRSD